MNNRQLTIVNKNHNNLQSRSGQAMVMVMLITVLLVSVTTLAVGIVITNSLSTMREQEGAHAMEIAESGAEEGILRILRDPVTSNGTYNLTVDSGSATVVITDDGGTKKIISKGTVGSYVKKVEVHTQVNAGQLVINSWREL